MSEPSIEAKQAAELEVNHWLDNRDNPLTEPREYGLFVQQAIDTATARLRKELELAWGIIANASGGDWEKESKEWQDTAAKWRDRVMPMLSHQQPSGTIPAKEVMERWKKFTAELGEPDAPLPFQQPSTPTTDIDEENYRELEQWAAKKYGKERKLT